MKHRCGSPSNRELHSARTSCVITSYSIHYTKLYDALPDYTGLPLDGYLAPGLILPYSAAAGCWWNRCSFCPERAEGNDYHPLPATQAVDELHALCTAYRPTLVHLLDNAISPALLRALVARPLPVPWYGFARIDQQLADPDFCRARNNFV